ncbi:MAG: hypothetical protein KIT84_01650 [Labilithrix sp.]|nr:hypothetical protein [Labilithrix sp.]MCW5809691.1 hypothetical protein [Labilithrix sp.]
MSIDVQVTAGGTVKNGAASVDPTTVARCSLCSKDVEASVGIGADRTACAPCLRDRLDALSVARFRLHSESGPRSIPWGKVTG